LENLPPIVFASGQFNEKEDEMKPGVKHHVKVLLVNLIHRILIYTPAILSLKFSQNKKYSFVA
jgi:hypothetical protein